MNEDIGAPPPPDVEDRPTPPSRKLARVVLGLFFLALVGVTVWIFIDKASDRPQPLPTDLPRSTFALPAEGGHRTDSREVLVRLRAFDKTCWRGNIDDDPVTGCGAVEWRLSGHPGVGGLYSATIQKTASDRTPIVLELVIDGDLVNSAETRKPLGTIAVTGG